MTDPLFNAKLLAIELASRLSVVAPAGVVVTARDSNVRVADDEHWQETILMEILGGPTARFLRPTSQALGWGSAAHIDIDTQESNRDELERLETAVSAVLSGVQDFIISTIRAQWPPMAGSDDHSGTVALPGVRAAGTLEFWYGPFESPVLRFQPIEYDELRSE